MLQENLLRSFNRLLPVQDHSLCLGQAKHHKLVFALGDEIAKMSQVQDPAEVPTFVGKERVLGCGLRIMAPTFVGKERFKN